MRDPNAHWRDSARSPKFFFVSAQAAYPLLLFLVHIKLWTFLLVLSVVLSLALLEYFGFTPIKFIRAFKVFLVGKMKYKKGWWE